MQELSLILKLLTIALVFLIAMYSDLRYQRIPNLLCVVTLTLGLLIQSYFAGLAGLLDALLSVVVAFVVLFPLFALRFWGAGDVKLMVAIASFLSLPMLFWSLIYGVMVGGLSSVLLALYKLGWSSCWEVCKHYLRCLYLRKYLRASDQGFLKLKVPFAPALAAGWVWACSQNPEVSLLLLNLQNQLGG